MLMMQSAHRDVLEASIPDNDKSRAQLVDELQSRGRAAVGASSWMDAKLLYEKALSVLTTASKVEDANRIAVLNSNLSLVLQHMGSMEDARQVAVAATEADPSYVKGWWRLGQALQKLPRRSSEAVRAFSKATELEPNNKALIKELEKCQKKALEEEEEEAKRLKEAAEEQMKMDEEEAPSAKPTTTQTRSATSVSSTNSSSTQPPPTTTAATTTTTTTSITTKEMDVDHEDDEKIFTKSDNVRGYKIVNGKKTSYFHNELSEEAKNLIGDIAPKKLEGLETAMASTASNGPANGASAWNKAGTWEEKDLTQWAKTTLQEHIEQATYVLPDSSPAPGAVVTVTKVTTIDGHASCALARGKKRYIYEFMVKLEWRLQGKNPESTSSSSTVGGGLDCTGSLAFPDIDGTIELGEGYEMHQFVVDAVSDNSLRPLIERFVQRGGFHESLNNAIDDWVRRFKSEY
jgi:tetratricopeptide (TPR) repeat protein